MQDQMKLLNFHENKLVHHHSDKPRFSRIAGLLLIETLYRQSHCFEKMTGKSQKIEVKLKLQYAYESIKKTLYFIPFLVPYFQMQYNQIYNFLSKFDKNINKKPHLKVWLVKFYIEDQI